MADIEKHYQLIQNNFIEYKYDEDNLNSAHVFEWEKARDKIMEATLNVGRNIKLSFPKDHPFLSLHKLAENDLSEVTIYEKKGERIVEKRILILISRISIRREADGQTRHIVEGSIYDSKGVARLSVIKKMIPKVLIGCPVNSRKNYCIQDYFKNISRFTYPSKDYYFVDNSANPSWHLKNVVAKGFKCDYVSPVGKRNNKYMCESQELIRDYFLQSDCTHWLSLECDLFPRSNIIEEMLAQDTPIVSMAYLIGQGKDIWVLKTEIENLFETNTNRNIDLKEGFLEWGTGNTKSKMFGLGCALIEREVIEQIPFVVNKDDTHHADTNFYFMLNILGYEVKYIEEIINHQNSNWSAVTDY